MHKPDILLSSVTWQFICHWEFCCCCSGKKIVASVTNLHTSAKSHKQVLKVGSHITSRTKQRDINVHSHSPESQISEWRCLFSGWIFPQQRGQTRQSSTGVLTGCPGLDYPSWASLTSFFQVVLLLSNYSLQFLWRKMGIWGQSI